MHDSPLLFEELPGPDGKLGIITLNRPQALNALNFEMVILLHQQLLRWEKMTTLKGVVIRATEGRAFCAGGDLRLAYEQQQAAKNSLLTQFFAEEYRLNYYLHHYPKPYIAFLDGITMGGGAGISLHGSHRLATERFLFAMPETGIGFFPDVGASYFLPRLPEGIGFYLGLTGSRLSCDDCLAIKLIDYKIPQAALQNVLTALVDTPFGAHPHATVSTLLQQFHQPAPSSPLLRYSPLIRDFFMKTRIEEIMHALDSNKQTWCQETAAILRKKSPTSLAVTLRQLHTGLHLDFAHCMQLEYQLMLHFIQGHDFFEGIRALLIDKDQAPQWQPAELKTLTVEGIEAYFKPLPGQTAPFIFT